MNGLFHIGATGLDAQQRGLEIAAHNIANMSTPAYKQSRAHFAQMVSAPRPAGDVPGQGPGFLGVRMVKSQVDFAQGTLTQTGAAMDIAINGTGFIELLGPGGQSLLWRGGTLKVNLDGYLAADNGMPLRAMISVPHDVDTLTISADGRVQALLAGSSELTEIGQIDITLDVDPLSLSTMGGGLYAPASEVNLVRSNPGIDGAGVLAQGFMETSNVDISSEMVTLMLLQRAYAADAHLVQAGDQLMGIANELMR